MTTLNNDFRIRRAGASVLVAKAEPFSCEVLGTLLQREGFDVVGRSSRLDDLIQQIRNKKPRCVIADAHIIGAHTDDMVRELTEVSKPPQFILYVGTHDTTHLGKTLEANFSGYLHAADQLDELYKCMRHTQMQVQYFSEGFKMLLKQSGLAEIDEPTRQKVQGLTKREKQVLYLITEGFSGVEIADKLCMSYRTLANHKQNMSEKLAVEGSKNILKFGLQIKSYLNSVQ